MNGSTHQGSAIRAMSATATVVLCLALAACGGADTDVATGNAAGDGGNGQSAATCKVPDFAGPYAAEFKNAYERSATELGRRILEDCQVTEAELNEAFDAQNACLAPYGLISSKGQTSQVRPSGLSDQEMLRKQEECANQTDLWNVEAMYDATRTNPDNLDSAAMKHEVYRCLKDGGLLPELIDEAEYDELDVTDPTGLSDGQIAEKNRQWQRFFHIYMETGDDGSPNPDYDAANAPRFWQCQSDPLGQ